MREPLFIKKNKAKWEHYETQFTNDPNELSERYINILDDLAYAQTFYPRSIITQYLNERAVKFYNQIYKKKKEPVSKLIDFWKKDMPLVIHKNRVFIWIALGIFFTSILLGTLSSIYDPRFIQSILGENYIEMTKENINAGDPFAVYKNSEKTNMFFYIAMNNISIAFILQFIGGIFFTVSSIYSLFQNGMMVGGFHYIFFKENMGWDFTLVVMIHGIFELFALVLAAAAGFRLFNSILFTGTYTRLVSVKKGFYEGMQLMILVFFLLLMAAFLESYITRLASGYVSKTSKDMFIPLWTILLILSSCISILVWYFFIYPAKVAKKQMPEEILVLANKNMGKVMLQ